jgi:hypothetical protein
MNGRFVGLFRGMVIGMGNDTARSTGESFPVRTVPLVAVDFIG